MALIKCPECGNMISDKAIKCPKCGCPVGRPSIQPSNRYDYGEHEEDSSPTVSRKWLYVIIGVLAAALIGITAFLLLKNTDSSDSSAALMSETTGEGPKTYALATSELGWLNVRREPSTSTRRRCWAKWMIGIKCASMALKGISGNLTYSRALKRRWKSIGTR